MKLLPADIVFVGKVKAPKIICIELAVIVGLWALMMITVLWR